jgi:hypothetical protein
MFVLQQAEVSRVCEKIPTVRLGLTQVKYFQSL